MICMDNVYKTKYWTKDCMGVYVTILLNMVMILLIFLKNKQNKCFIFSENEIKLKLQKANIFIPHLYQKISENSFWELPRDFFVY